ncbi:MAG: NAD(P)H-hydrate epimerase [Bacillota bacterium]|nr:NAD(P)H-hydrate epimerase [Bacillota bacterium]
MMRVGKDTKIKNPCYNLRELNGCSNYIRFRRDGEISMETLKDKQFSGKKAVTAAQMKEIERWADEAGLSYYQMMENAGRRAAEFIATHHSIAGQKVLILCGRGNNGGDGFVVARKLEQMGAQVAVALIEGEPKTPDAMENYRLCKELNISVLCGAGESDAILSQVKKAEIIVDGIFGTGFRGILGETVRKITEQINISIASVYALDIPSGVNGDSGEADIDSIRADFTLSFHRLKPAHTMIKAIEYCGDVVCLSIGIEEVLKEERQ